MNIIFLDIDGVLNNSAYASLMNHLYGGNGYGGFNKYSIKCQNIKWDPYNVGALKTLMNKTGASIVISSTWRKTHDINNFKTMFQLYGLAAGKIIGVTPNLSRRGITDMHPRSAIRGDDINAWLGNNPQVNNYVILDDGSDFYPGQNLVLTNADYGLTDADMLQAVQILKGTVY